MITSKQMKLAKDIFIILYKDLVKKAEGDAFRLEKIEKAAKISFEVANIFLRIKKESNNKK